MKVFVCIREGFGNQLFTYACGYALARKKNAKLILDTTLLDCGNFRKLELLKTGVEYSMRLSYGRKEDLFSRALWNKIKRRKAIGLGTVICCERNPWCYSPECFETERDIYLYGFWQSFCYFNEYETDLKRMVVPQYAMPDHVSSQIEKVKKERSVALHIRRGDYVRIGCELPLSYYEIAIKEIKKSFSDAKFYVFSDDIEYAETNLGPYLENAVFWEDNSEESTLNDFFLMSACQNQIIANSTFSWWAAYLNVYKDKKVYAPVFGKWKSNFYLDSWMKIII